MYMHASMQKCVHVCVSYLLCLCCNKTSVDAKHHGSSLSETVRAGEGLGCGFRATCTLLNTYTLTHAHVYVFMIICFICAG